MNTDLSTADERTVAAILLISKGFVPWPLRYSNRDHRTENWTQLSLLARSSSRRHERWIQVQVEELIDGFIAPCTFEVLTGAISRVIALRTWNVESDVVVAIQLPPTPLVIENAGGTYYFFRHPDHRIGTTYATVPYQGSVTLLQIIGDGGAVIIPPVLFERVCEWPDVADLPSLDFTNLMVGLP